MTVGGMGFIPERLLMMMMMPPSQTLQVPPKKPVPPPTLPPPSPLPLNPAGPPPPPLQARFFAASVPSSLSQRMIEPDEVAQAALLLACSTGAINGTALRIDGGGVFHT